MKAVVLAAGRGTRMRPLTDSIPKPLLPVAGRPLVTHVLDRCVDACVDEAVLVVNYEEEKIRGAIGDEYRGMAISYARQEEKRGTGDAVRSAPRMEEDFLVLNGDLFFQGDLLNRLVETDGAAMAVREVDDPERYGSVVVNDGVVEELVEKSDDPPSRLVNAGIYRFTPEVFDLLNEVEESERGEIELTDAVSATKGVRAVRLDEYWLDVGYPWNLLDANAHALQETEQRNGGDVEEGAVLKGPVSIGSGTVVRSGAYVEGPVVIGEDCDVGPNCYVRPGTSIGNRVRIGNAVEVKNSIVMDGTNVGHLSYVGDSVLGPGSNFGAGTVVANLRHDGENVFSEVKGDMMDTMRRKMGVVTGSGVKTGVNTSIDPGTILGSSVWTLPGDRVSGTVLEADTR